MPQIPDDISRLEWTKAALRNGRTVLDMLAGFGLGAYALLQYGRDQFRDLIDIGAQVSSSEVLRSDSNDYLLAIAGAVAFFAARLCASKADQIGDQIVQINEDNER